MQILTPRVTASATGLLLKTIGLKISASAEMQLPGVTDSLRTYPRSRLIPISMSTRGP